MQADRSSIVLFDDNLIEGQVLGEYPPSGTLGQIIPLRGIPVEERLLETKKPLIINDVASELSQLGEAGEILLKYGVQSVVIFPVVAKDKTLLGSIGIDSIKQKRLFSEEDIRQGNIFANQIATAIENAKLYERQKRREELYKRLNHALRSIWGEYDPIRLLHETLNLAIKLSDCSGGCIYINLPHSEMLELVIVSGIPQDQVGLMVSHQNSLAGMVVQTGRPRVYDHNNREGNSDFMLLKHDFVAMAGIPIGQFGQVEAVVIVADKNPHRQFSGTDLEILTRFAEQGAIALNTSRSFGADRRIHSQLDILRQINEYILKTPDDLEKILNVFLTSVTAGYGLQFNRAALFLMDEQGEYLKGRIGIGYLNEDEARDFWRSDPVKNFSDYIHHLEFQHLTCELPWTSKFERLNSRQLAIGLPISFRCSKNRGVF